MAGNDQNTTQRAYTLRLCGTDPNDQSWRVALWCTHEAVNKGAYAFGDWLLTMRGGLDHTLADAPIADRDPTDKERKARRILLALSWLSVESELGAPEEFIIASGEDAEMERNGRVLTALEDVLKKRGLRKEKIQEWIEDCSPSLSAAIRKDAVWVNRSKAFDAAIGTYHGLTREYAYTVINSFFRLDDKYLQLPDIGVDDQSGAGADVAESPEFRTLARQWVSTNFGTGEKSDADLILKQLNILVAANLIRFAGQSKVSFIKEMCNLLGIQGEDVDALRTGIGWKTGRKSKGRLAIDSLPEQVTSESIQRLQQKFKEEVSDKQRKRKTRDVPEWMKSFRQAIEKECGMPFRGDRDHIGEFAVMLDHAARRVSQAHSWIKRAEAERRRFEEDAKKMEVVPEKTKEWLDSFCSERSDTSGALEPYRIRKRAVDGWKEVVAAWSKADCLTTEDRIAAARALQDDPEISKFGDIQLFEALAEEDAMCVWHKDGDPANAPDPQPLIDYALASEADFKKRQFKVPAYRHPDALKHPVFCDFGKSRWAIDYEIHRNAKTPSPRALTLTLWTGKEMKPVSLRWQSKRLAHDLNIKSDGRGEGASLVTRADRMGRAASGVSKDDEVEIAGLFETKEWNGRLQAPRCQLEDIARHVDKHGWDSKASVMLNAVQWLVTFSARLQPQEPWREYAKNNENVNLNLDKKNRQPHTDENKNRKGRHAKLVLSRLPGLRVLSVDLGHRYAAACAVWETLSIESFRKEIRGRTILRGGKDAEALYCHTEHEENGNKHVTIYRRIGADKLPDGATHPAPWARLDRQFLIKLQGEGEEAREASNEEIWAVHRMESELGRAVPLIDRLVAAGWGRTEKQAERLEALKRLGWEPPLATAPVVEDASGEDADAYRPSLAVDELMSSAVRTLRLALKRHGDRARIAYAMTATYKSMPGDRKYYFTKAEELSSNDDQATREEKHIEFILDALVLWQSLISSRGWRDEAAKLLWDKHIAKLPVYEAPEELGEDITSVERKKKRDNNREKLYGVAKALVQDRPLRNELHDAWNKRWEQDDARWREWLRWSRDWILPRGRQAGDHSIRKVGGLSLNRLATLTEFRRKVQVGYYTRLRPDGTRKEIGEAFGQKVLDDLEQMREQRVKQLASRIVEAALGIGSEDRAHWEGGKRPRQRIDDRRFAPCHAVVIENLTHYRPEETRTRRENRQLMTWSSSKIKKYLKEACQLHGLHLCEVTASYTSRQDSRTGAPGIRCQDVAVREFMLSPFWRKQVKRAEAKQAENKGDSRERFLCELNAKWKNKTEVEWRNAGVVRIPLRGGAVFVSADRRSPASKGIQADLNAAANIGLRALIDPDWPGKWWYVPCFSSSFIPTDESTKGSEAITGKPLKERPTDDTGKMATRKRSGRSSRSSGGVVNLWRDVSSLPVSADKGPWEEYQPYWNKVQERVVRILHDNMVDSG